MPGTRDRHFFHIFTCWYKCIYLYFSLNIAFNLDCRASFELLTRWLAALNVTFMQIYYLYTWHTFFKLHIGNYCTVLCQNPLFLSLTFLFFIYVCWLLKWLIHISLFSLSLLQHPKAKFLCMSNLLGKKSGSNSVSEFVLTLCWGWSLSAWWHGDTSSTEPQTSGRTDLKRERQRKWRKADQSATLGNTYVERFSD